MYGAMGVALGIVISEVLVLIFVFVIYQGSASGRREAEIGMKGTDTFFSQVRVLLFSMGGDTVVSDKVSAYLHSVYPDCAE